MDKRAKSFGLVKMMNAAAKEQNIWRIPPAGLSLEKTEVHVWLARLDCENIGEGERIISADELARADKFRFEKDRNKFIAGRSVLRRILGAYLQKKPNLLRFAYNQFGKPFLCGENESKLEFNLSHSGSLALYAFSLNREIGVDIEERNADFIEEGVISLSLSHKETEHFHSLPPDERTLFFFDCWTKKEAYLKAHGCGLSLEPNQLETSELNETGFFFPNLPDIDGFSAALAVEGNNPLLKFWQAD
jgi:4'-phosphopantetheinyl transferase